MAGRYELLKQEAYFKPVALLSRLLHGHKIAIVFQSSQLLPPGEGTWQQAAKPFRSLWKCFYK